MSIRSQTPTLRAQPTAIGHKPSENRATGTTHADTGINSNVTGTKDRDTGTNQAKVALRAQHMSIRSQTPTLRAQHMLDTVTNTNVTGTTERDTGINQGKIAQRAQHIRSNPRIETPPEISTQFIKNSEPSSIKSKKDRLVKKIKLFQWHSYFINKRK